MRPRVPFLWFVSLAAAPATAQDVPPPLAGRTFTGTPDKENLGQRWRAEVATRILAEAMATADWSPHDASDDERAAIAARVARPLPAQAEWLTRRLQKLHDLLPPR